MTRPTVVAIWQSNWMSGNVITETGFWGAIDPVEHTAHHNTWPDWRRKRCKTQLEYEQIEETAEFRGECFNKICLKGAVCNKQHFLGKDC